MFTCRTQPWIKICGIRDVETAVAIARLRADAIGLNFYAKSPRNVSDVATARKIVAALPDDTVPVGLFVNHSVEQIRCICRETGIRVIQLHGDEPDSIIGELTEYRIIRAVRPSASFAEEAGQHLASYVTQNVRPDAWLADAQVPGSYGGTGQTIDWDRLAPAHRTDDWPPLILAGGLTPANVAAAIATVQPWGVDVASGVESSPGLKDLAKVERFIAACRG